ncbi:MAG: hypothetical protein Ct9H90mP5_00200 [Acidimicrobiaceae bacterium]|nr:MAG: hypothetical protein Ct9H90mP5_00200 [Acidimicrobiaceae bacterium]
MRNANLVLTRERIYEAIGTMTLRQTPNHSMFILVIYEEKLTKSRDKIDPYHSWRRILFERTMTLQLRLTMRWWQSSRQ